MSVKFVRLYVVLVLTGEASYIFPGHSKFHYILFNFLFIELINYLTIMCRRGKKKANMYIMRCMNWHIQDMEIICHGWKIANFPLTKSWLEPSSSWPEIPCSIENGNRKFRPTQNSVGISGQLLGLVRI